jgi:hypothetical protein
MGALEEALDAFRSGDNQLARQLSGRFLAEARTTDDRAGEVDALCMLARVALREGDFAQVSQLADEARASAGRQAMNASSACRSTCRPSRLA